MSKIRFVMAAAVAAILLGGCGEKPYTLTEEEQNIVVDYSAHVVAKYNTSQKEGLSYVAASDTQIPLETEKVEQAQTEETSQNSGSTGENGFDVTESTEASQETGNTPATLSELFGKDDIEITYTGATLDENYMESTYYSMDASAGKQYLVVGIDITNNGSAEAQVDNMTLAPAFSITAGTDVSVSQETTVLLKDFSTYQGTIAAGATQSTVLLFEVPDTVTETANLALYVSVSGAGYQITL